MKFSQALAALPLAAALVAAAPISKRSDVLNGKSVATWWGQDTHELKDLCASPDFDIIILSFLTSLSPPALNLAAHGGSASDAQKKQKWDGLIDGTVAPSGTTSVASQITACQQGGKKIMISFGGDARDSKATFDSTSDATNAANIVWNLLLGGTDEKTVPANVRPFGKVVLDGLDLDNETGKGQYYTDFISKLRSLTSSDKSKTYLLSGSPQVSDIANANAGVPDAIYPSLDFVNVQFYNNPQDSGELGHPDFVARVGQWNDKIAKLNKNAKLMVAAPSSTLAANGHDVGVLSSSDITNAINAVKAKSYSQFGGVSIWSGGFAMDNGNWQTSVKKALTGGAGGSGSAAPSSLTSQLFGAVEAIGL